MEIEVSDVLNYKNGSYLVLAICKQDDNEYYFVNKFIDEEPTKDYFIMTIKNDELVIEEDKEKLDVLLAIFQKKIEKLITD